MEIPIRLIHFAVLIPTRQVLPPLEQQQYQDFLPQLTPPGFTLVFE